MARNKKRPYYSEITISDIGAEGKSLAKIDDMVIFTTHVVPGDVVDLQVTKKHKRYSEAIVKKIHSYSAERAEPFCQHYGTCGGCKWQVLPYGKQLYYKKKQVEDQLRRIGKLDLPEILAILGSEKTTFYRNKLEFTFSDKRWLTTNEIGIDASTLNINGLGFHIPGMFDKVMNIEKCWLQKDPSNSIRNFVYRYALENNLAFFNLKHQSGFLRNLIIRTTTTNEIMVIFSFFHENEKERIKLLQTIKSEFPEITSLQYVINPKANDAITDQKIEVFYGRGYILEQMENLKFKIGPKSFYQTNPEQAYVLYKVVREFANLSGTETVYDLYTGTGTIAQFVASNAKKIIGIEYVPEAIDDAKTNAMMNNIKNAEFFAGDIKNILNDEFIQKHGRPDIIITDPPRNGMHQDVILKINELAPDKIVYVSCNPATQARDLSLMTENYRITKVQPVDMFPQTHHVENVVLLEKIKG